MTRELLIEFLRAYPAQPATAYWRAIEIGALLRRKLPEGRGLDLGCGDGKLTRIVVERSGPRELIGVDLDRGETALAEASGLYRAVVTGDAAATGLDPGSFDFVFSNSVLEHIPNLEGVVAEIGRLLRPGGIFLATVPTIGFHRNLRGSLLPWVARADYLRVIDARLAHFHYPSTGDWREMLARHGMTLEHRFGYLDAAECRRWETLSRFTGGLLYALSPGRRRPIEIQRSLGLRAAQSRYALPRALASGLAAVIARAREDAPHYWHRDEGLDDEDAGCLLVAARRT